MRIVISGHETCGIINDLAQALRFDGHRVTTIAMSEDAKWFAASYDYDQYDVTRTLLQKFIGASAADLLVRAAGRADVGRSLEYLSRLQILKGCELYIQVWGCLPLQLEVLKFLRSRRTPTAFLLMGSDVRDYNVFCSQFDVYGWRPPEHYFNVSRREKLLCLRTIEKYGSAIFSVPDQMGLALRPYYHLKVPLALGRFAPQVPGRRRPIVVHAPSIAAMKGTDVIEKTVAELLAEGVKFEYLQLQDVKRDQVLQILADADILIDQLILHGPGWLGFEGMASGCAVMTRCLQSSTSSFQPPIVNVNHSTLKAELRSLIGDTARRVRLATEGVKYVQAHDVSMIASEIISRAVAPDNFPPDYYPDHISVASWSAEELSLLREFDKLVMSEPWFRPWDHHEGGSDCTLF